MADDDRFPYDMSFMEFATYSADSTFGNNILCKKNMRSIVVGGYLGCSHGFYEVFLNQTTNKFTFKSFLKTYNKPNATLTKIAKAPNAICAHCFLTNDNNFIIIFNPGVMYNVYDMRKDTWLLSNETSKFEFGSDHSRGLLIDDKIIVISVGKYLHFYSIVDDISDPIEIDTFEMASKMQEPTPKYRNHGMCLIEYKKDITTTKKEKEEKEACAYVVYVYRFKLLLFGGQSGSFRDTLVIVDVCLSLSCIDGEKSDMKLTKITGSPMVVKSVDESLTFYSFGYECILNSKYEAIIVMIGGFGNEKCVSLFNVATKQLIHKAHVC